MQWDQAVDRAWIVTRIAQPALRGQVSLRTIPLEGFVAIHARSGVSCEALPVRFKPWLSRSA